MTEPDRPQVTLSDPGRSAVPVDVLVADEPVRRVPRWVAPFAAGALLAGVAVPPAVSAVRDDRREDRAARVLADQQAAQREREDTLSLRISDLRLTTNDDEGQLGVTVLVSSTGGLGVVLDGMRLTGSVFGTTAEEVAVAGFVDPAESPAEVAAPVQVDCAAVRTAFVDGPRPTGVSLVLNATPRSGRQQLTEPFAVPDALLQETLLDACRLGDPDAVPTATVDVVKGEVVAEVSTGRGPDATLVGFRLAGVQVVASGPLPATVARQTALFVALRVGKVDCARLTVGPLVVLVRTADGATREITATAGTQPGSTPLPDFLTRLKAQRCR